ncbi:MAG TPA: serine hydrolase domain-containing protein [Gemmatimonadales bacterium]|nr:serine hydrolase domain-containing protein [Gemmatimonadales bacterium]
MRRLRRPAVVAVLVVGSSGIARAQEPAAWRSFVSGLESYARADSIVGAAAVLVQDGRITARQAVGFADRDAGERVTDRTIFHWASITKTLTAVAVMQLRDRGMLTLDDPVTRWIPELRQLHNPYGSMDAITVRMLLSHSAGFQDPTWPYDEGRPWEPFEPTRWEQLVAMMPYQEIHFSPGTRYSYSNPAYIYLARIIELLTDDPWAVYVQKNIWTPLGMTRSYVNTTPYHLAADRSNRYHLIRDSAGHEQVRAGGRDFDPGVTIPNGGWNAPLDDVAMWMAFLTGADGGDPGRRRRFETVLGRNTLEEMWRAVVPAGGSESMGLGFFLRGQDGRRLVGHTGDQGGFRSFMYFDPVRRSGVIAVVNTSNEVRADASAEGFKELLRQGLEVLRP